MANVDHLTEKTKEYDRKSNNREIERGFSEILTQLNFSLLEDNPTQFTSHIQLFDRLGISHKLIVNCQASFAQMDENGLRDWADFNISIEERNKEKIATRGYNFYDSFEVLSHLRIYNSNFKGMNIGSAMLHQGEKIKLRFAKKISPSFGSKILHSTLTDASDPPGWTTESALALGYKPIKGAKNKFEKFDNLDENIQLPDRLNETWEKQKISPFQLLLRKYRVFKKKLD